MSDICLAIDPFLPLFIEAVIENDSFDRQWSKVKEKHTRGFFLSKIPQGGQILSRLLALLKY